MRQRRAAERSWQQLTLLNFRHQLVTGENPAGPVGRAPGGRIAAPEELLAVGGHRVQVETGGARGPGHLLQHPAALGSPLRTRIRARKAGRLQAPGSCEERAL